MSTKRANGRSIPGQNGSAARRYLAIPYGEGEGLGAAFATFVPVGVLFFFLRACAARGNRWRDGIVLLLFAASVLSMAMAGAGTEIWSGHLGFCLRSDRATHCRVRQSQAEELSTLAARVDRSHLCHLRIRSLARQHLPPGSWVLNASGSQENNFLLAGEHLTNHVMANFEVPSELTLEPLERTGADYVVEVVATGKDPGIFLPDCHLTLVEDELVPTGEDRVR